MKGYVIKEGKISLTEKDDRVIGTIELPNGETSDIDIPNRSSKSWFNLKTAKFVLDSFKYASSVPRTMQVGPFGFWLDDKGWHFTSWDEVDDVMKLFSFMFDKAEHNVNA